MPRQIGGVRVDADLGQNRGPRLACPRVSLRDTLARARQIRVVANREIDEVIQLRAAEPAIPVLRGPCGTLSRAAVLECGGRDGGRLWCALGGAAARERCTQRCCRAPAYPGRGHARAAHAYMLPEASFGLA